MKVCFRADASVRLGSGHVMRCATLADEVQRRGGSAFFICRELPGNLCAYLESRGFTVFRLPFEAEITPPAAATQASNNQYEINSKLDALMTAQILKSENPDWLVVDNYALDRGWESTLRDLSSRILVIDDLADRAHECDILLDQNLHRTPWTRYEGLLPDKCVLLAGPRYALLRREFAEARKTLRKRDGTVGRIFVFFGSSDPGDETTKALNALALLGRADIAVDVIVGMSNPNKERIREFCSTISGWSFHCQVTEISSLMAKADLSLGAGGSATWERCYLGLPSVTIAVAENQLETAKAVAEAGAAIYAGRSSDISSPDLARIVEETLDRPRLLSSISSKSLEIMGDTGAPLGTEIVMDAMRDIR